MRSHPARCTPATRRRAILPIAIPINAESSPGRHGDTICMRGDALPPRRADCIAAQGTTAMETIVVIDESELETAISRGPVSPHARMPRSQPLHHYFSELLAACYSRLSAFANSAASRESFRRPSNAPGGLRRAVVRDDRLSANVRHDRVRHQEGGQCVVEVVRGGFPRRGRLPCELCALAPLRETRQRGLPFSQRR